MDDSSDRIINKYDICAEKLKNTNAVANEGACKRINIKKKQNSVNALRWLNQIANRLTHKANLFLVQYNKNNFLWCQHML